MALCKNCNQWKRQKNATLKNESGQAESSWGFCFDGTKKYYDEFCEDHFAPYSTGFEATNVGMTRRQKQSLKRRGIKHFND